MMTAMSSFSPRSRAPKARFSKSRNSAMRSSSSAINAPSSRLHLFALCHSRNVAPLPLPFTPQLHFFDVGREIRGPDRDPALGNCKHRLTGQLTAPSSQYAVVVLPQGACHDEGQQRLQLGAGGDELESLLSF